MTGSSGPTPVTPVVEINVRRSGAVGHSVSVKGKINETGANLLIDTGAAVTIISQSVYNNIHPDHRPPLIEPLDKTVLKTADESTMNVMGQATFHFDIAGKVFTWDAYVALIHDDALIGFDFLYNFDCVVEARRGLKIDGILVDCDFSGTSFATRRVTLKSSIVVPPNSEILTTGCVEKSTEDNNSNNDVIIEPLPAGLRNKESVLVAATLCNEDQVKYGAPLRLMNTTSESISMLAGQTVAYASDVIDLQEIDHRENSSSVIINRISGANVAATTQPPSSATTKSDNVSTQLHNDLNELYERSSTGLNKIEKEKLNALLLKHSDTFAKSKSDLGRCGVLQHEINTGDAKPIRQPARRPPRAFQDEEDTIINDQLKAGIIQPSTSPWASPLVYVKKKDGTTRPCVDYRKLNSVTEFDCFPLPKIEECLDSLGGSRFFSTLDLQAGYWQIEVKEEDRPKTAFRTRSGLYEYVVMPFGLSNAPSTFERCMELVMKGLQWKTLLVYLDDLIIFSKTFDEHLSRLDEVLHRLSRAGLKLKPSKCALFQYEVLYLGHIVTPDGVKPNPDKVRAVTEWPTPTNIGDVRSFLGLCSYYRKFIRGFATISRPLNRLLESGVQFDWNTECELAFSELKSALTCDKVMAYPCNTGTFILDTDASAFGIGATLSQIQVNPANGRTEERPIAYASRTLTKTQRRYCVTRRELLAVVTFVHHFRHYLLGQKFTIRTDHSSLRWLVSFREPMGQMARWLEMLSQFNFRMEYRAGKNHSNADALSRAPCDPESCSCHNGDKLLAALPCGGCPHCQKQHAAWSAFVDYEDVIPLTTRRVTSKIDNEMRETETPSSTPDANDKAESSSYNLGISSVLGYVMTLLLLIFVGSPLYLCKTIRNSCLRPFKSMYVRAVTTRRQALTKEKSTI